MATVWTDEKRISKKLYFLVLFAYGVALNTSLYYRVSLFASASLESMLVVAHMYPYAGPDSKCMLLRLPYKYLEMFGNPTNYNAPP